MPQLFMPETIENYIPQNALKGLKKQTFKIWSVVLFLVAVWIFIILLAPIAAANGLNNISNPIYNFFSHICHQMPSRSFHTLDQQFAVCSRCFGVYFGILLGFIIYPLFRSMEKTEPFPRFWLFLAMIPIGVDWSLTVFGIWENTHFTRVLTGLILGFTCAIFIFPALVELSQIILVRKQSKLEKAV
ncbi:MAG: DUF2085 domain-containing protein [Acidobacteriota bacterium]|nr:DUF2085 domain-containing protein [Acidobacteriota bacterium]